MIEAALFMSSGALDVKELSKITGISSLGHLEELVGELSREYEKRGVEIIKTPEGWCMQVQQDLLKKVSHLSKYSDLEDGHKRTLALVVYKEPVMQSEIIKTQGNKAYSYIKKLHRKGLIKSEKKGRTKIITLTNEFERYFGDQKEKIKRRLSNTADKVISESESLTKDPQKKITEIVQEKDSVPEKTDSNEETVSEESI